MTTLSLVDVTKVYPNGVTAIQNVSLTVRAGELLVLLGPSGCGKTTILRLIAGLLSPTQGDLQFNGRSVLAVPAEERGAVMVFQKHLLFPFMSVGDNVAFGLKVRGLDSALIRQRVDEALTAVQLPNFADRWPDQLSGGQQQRVALARALVVQPKLLLLDEPLSNLDQGLRGALRQMIRRVQKQAGITTILVTHDQAEAISIADRIALLIDGRLQQIGPPSDFYERPKMAEIARFFGNVNLWPGFKKGTQVQTDIGTLEVASSRLPDGMVLLTIRPEAIEIGANGYNNINAQVYSSVYQGVVRYCTVRVNDTQLQLAASPFQSHQVGEHITLHLPRERICVLPPE